MLESHGGTKQPEISITVDYFNTKNSLLAACFWSSDVIGGKVIILWELKELFRGGIMTYFITDSLVVRVFRGIVTYCVDLRLAPPLVPQTTILRTIEPQEIYCM